MTEKVVLPEGTKVITQNNMVATANAISNGLMAKMLQHIY